MKLESITTGLRDSVLIFENQSQTSIINRLLSCVYFLDGNGLMSSDSLVFRVSRGVAGNRTLYGGVLTHRMLVIIINYVVSSP